MKHPTILLVAATLLLLVSLALPARAGLPELPVGLPAWDSRANQFAPVPLQVPARAPDERLVLSFRARVDAPGPGSIYALQVLVDDVPVADTWVQSRLLNKTTPWRPSANSGEGFDWMYERGRLWLVPFGRSWEEAGADAEYLLDLTDVVRPGEQVTIAFKASVPQSGEYRAPPDAYRSASANGRPMLIDQVGLKPMDAADREAIAGALDRPEPVRTVVAGADLPVDLEPDYEDYPYELLWSTERPQQFFPQITFDSIDGWTLDLYDEGEFGLEHSKNRLVHQRRTLAVHFPAGATRKAFLRPPQPIDIAEPFNAVQMWYGGQFQKNYHYDAYNIGMTVLIEDAAGKQHAIGMAEARTEYYGFSLGKLSPAAVAQIAFPARFVGIGLTFYDIRAAQPILFESICFHTDEETLRPRTYDKPIPGFPRHNNGVLPIFKRQAETEATADGEAFALKSTTEDGVTVEFRIDPAQGMFNGIRARFAGGDWFQPMAGGGISLDFLPVLNGAVEPGSAELLGAELNGSRLECAWQLELANGATAAWTCAYQILDRSLVMDVACAGGLARGLELGVVKGLKQPAMLRVPYLVRFWPGMTEEFFFSLLPDYYRSDYSRYDAACIPGTADTVGIGRRTLYGRLSDGSRNDLRERIIFSLSDELLEVLPNHANPVSPNRERLAPKLFAMGATSSPGRASSLKRYGIDHVVTTDFYTMFVRRLGEGFTARWRPRPNLSIQNVRDWRNFMAEDLGYLFGSSMDLCDVFSLGELWRPEIAARDSEGRIKMGWTGCTVSKRYIMPELAEFLGSKLRKHFQLQCLYMDTHSNRAVESYDFQAGAPGAGIGWADHYAGMQCMNEIRDQVGSTVSEGMLRMYWVGIADMDYAPLLGHGGDPSGLMPFVDFDLFTLQPYSHGTMMGHAPYQFFDKGAKGHQPLYRDPGTTIAPIEFYKWVGTSMAYGHMMMVGYGYNPPLSRYMQLYAMMQPVQAEYQTDHAVEVLYHDGEEYLTASQALRKAKRNGKAGAGGQVYMPYGRVKVTYSRGLVYYFNYESGSNWTVEEGGQPHVLPPYGWLAFKPGAGDEPELLSFSALVDGKRLDYMSCADHVYLNTINRRAAYGGVDLHGAVWIKHGEDGLRVIPCGNLGAPGEEDQPFALGGKDRPYGVNPPRNRGCRGAIRIDLAAVGGNPQAQVTGRNFDGGNTKAQARIEDGTLILVPDAATVDYLLTE